MKQNLMRLVEKASEYLVDGQGFKLRNSRFTKVDGLARSVWFWPAKNATAALYSFDVLLDLGIPALSPISAKAQEWVVRASCDKAYRRLELTPRLRFAFQSDVYDPAVEEAVLTAMRAISEAFFLRLDTPRELYEFVKRNAEEFASTGMAADNEFKQYDLMPWNAVPRLELAAIYGAYVGHSEEAAVLEANAIAHATKYGIDHSGISANIARAADIGPEPDSI